MPLNEHDGESSTGIFTNLFNFVSREFESFVASAKGGVKNEVSMVVLLFSTVMLITFIRVIRKLVRQKNILYGIDHARRRMMG